MVTVASKELKNRLGRYLQLVRTGEPVQITDRGKPIGCIVPLQSPAASPDVIEWSRLIASGGLSPGSGKPLRRHKPAKLKPGPSIAEMIAEDRR
jgi:prevent-host-death family protein